MKPSERLTAAIVSWRLGPGTAEFVLGDLAEARVRRRTQSGSLAAWLWYWLQIARLMLPARPSIGTLMSAAVRDFRLAGRTLSRQPLFAFTVSLTLALAIGANAVIFSMVDMLLLRPLPIAEPDRVGWIFGVDETRAGMDRADISPADYLDFTSASAFSHVAALGPAAHTLTGRGDARRVVGYRVTPSLFDVWDMRVQHGRRLHDADAAAGAPPVALLTNAYWMREFGGDPSIVGQFLTLSGTPHQVVGILGSEIEYGDIVNTQIWTPYALSPSAADRVDRQLTVMGKLSPGVTIEQADAEVKAIAARLKREHAASHANWSARSITAREGMTNSQTWLILGLLVATVTMVLLIASANITNILLARMAARKREIAVRSALGASRFQIARQILLEALVLALAGAAAGLGLARAGIAVLSAMAPGNFLFEMLEVNYRVVAFAMALAFMAPVLFGILPAMQSARLHTGSSLGDLGTRVAGGRSATRIRGALVVAQIALAMTLMVVAALAVRSIVGIMGIDLGFQSGTLAVARFEMPAWRYASEGEIRTAAAAALDAAAAAPGVSRVVMTSLVPAIDADVIRPLEIDGVPLGVNESRTAGETIAGHGYFEALGIPVLAGRPFDSRDRAGAQAVAIVSRTSADRYLGGARQAIARRVRLGDTAWATIVGVVENVANPDVDEAPNPIVYLPFEQHPRRSAVLLAVSPQPDAVPGALRDVMRRLDPDIAVEGATFDDLLIQEFAATRVIVALFMAFGGIATLLAASGLYGVIAFVVAQRTREFGVRLALGARPADVGRLMLSQGGRLIGIGLVLGLAGSIALAQLTRGILYGVSVSDPSTYAAIAAVVAVTAIAATSIPARRAMRVDPIQALRTE